MAKREKNNLLDDSVVDSMFEFDELQLDKEWEEQPRLVMRYGRLSVEYKSELDAEEAKLKLVDAELDDLIRRKPTKFFDNDEKPTEAGIKAKILAHTKHQTQQEVVQACSKRVAMVSAIMVALEHRKRSLEGRVQLFVHEYTAAPRVKGKARDYIEERTTHKSKGKIKK